MPNSPENLAQAFTPVDVLAMLKKLLSENGSDPALIVNINAMVTWIESLSPEVKIFLIKDHKTGYIYPTTKPIFHPN